ncbi:MULTISPECIES: choice-of-anchor I family protein [unclassified Pseudoalteromonas]|uniref:choice-of-anchor I family protein n=1 Tax=unclassified Pseudoalteromonas TaxID=194690 RepID=UPI0023593D48|nr:MULTISPECIES: choice-of-anchor I family protein [unclassified Pseudoalteromonas]MDC9565468.1 choice-of-anchor I family protein [Pseudoalteromonas sp. GAB2316C]MDC9569745.1 choice-of-anchor I family protein [Pseudoalteromonas sp. GABNB9D]MDC9573912.1 choice-of-anchor I family protein [Pseudoalteromonas sp. GABNS16A]MDC9578317.1 choice-of-anchor I family protein [Pseudoalteromonas sp. GABNS16E]MDC9585870.1 choice-of-anchor I family protein [Pseudoalteromonas sp. GABNS16C]
MLKRSLIALSLISILTGCSLDGDDGQDGTQGIQGEQGTAGQNGTNGTNANSALNISLVGRAVLNAQSPEGAAEIVAYQASKKWIYAINSSGDEAVVNIIPADTFDTAALVQDNEGIVNATNLTSTITLTLNDNTPGDANSIAIDENNQMLAVAMAAKNVGEAGQIAFYDISGDSPAFIKNVLAGFLPDMVTFNHDGTKVVVANEGEPNGDYSIDPEGSVSIINIVEGVVADTATNIDFTTYNSQQAELESDGFVFANPTGRTINGNVINTTVAMDLEPEYVSISKDNNYAYVSIQENNGLAIINLEDNSVELKALGFKDWSDLQIDASDKDGGVNFKSYPGLYGMYQPDTISSFSWKGANFIVSANEGDAREYFFDVTDEADCAAKGGLDYDENDGCLAYIDESRVEDLTLAANFDYLNNDDDDIGRLKVSTVKGNTNDDGQYESLYAYGARSFTIWDSNGLVVFDSGDDIGRITASVHGEAFNNNEDENEGDTRSDDKGAEPEALTIGTIDERTFAFIGLERMGGIMVYDITNPYDVQFEDYFYNRGVIEGADITGDLAPEGMVFVPAEQSATGEPLLIIGNEISGSIAVWQIAAN